MTERYIKYRIKAFQHAKRLMILCVLVGIYACSNSEYLERFLPTEEDSYQGIHTQMQIQIQKYGEVEALSAGDFINPTLGTYVYLHINGTKGFAVNKYTEDYWLTTLSPNGLYTNGALSAVFINKNVEPQSVVDVGPYVGTYLHSNANYSYETSSRVFRADIQLKPAYGRLRFKGDAYKSVKLWGIKFSQSYSYDNDIFSLKSDTLKLVTGETGYTDYLYGDFADANIRSLLMESDGHFFYTTCSMDVLAKGRSGVLSIPTALSHNGWLDLSTIDASTIIIRDFSNYTEIAWNPRAETEQRYIIYINNFGSENIWQPSTGNQSNTTISVNNGYGSDDDWNPSTGGQSNTTISVNKGYGSDEEWKPSIGGQSSATISVNKGYGSDEEWQPSTDGQSNTTVSVNKGYGSDEEWQPSTGGQSSAAITVNKGYGSDEEWQPAITVLSGINVSINKGYGNEINWNEIEKAIEIGKNEYGADVDYSPGTHSNITIVINKYGNDEQWLNDHVNDISPNIVINKIIADDTEISPHNTGNWNFIIKDNYNDDANWDPYISDTNIIINGYEKEIIYK